MSKIILEEQAAPSTPSANQVSIYPKANGRLYYKDDAGVEIPLNGYAIQGWVRYNGGSNTIDGSFNVTSVTDTGTGDFTVNWTTSFSSSAYAVAGFGGVTPTYVGGIGAAIVAASVRISVRTDAGVATDDSQVTLIAVGDV